MSQSFTRRLPATLAMLVALSVSASAKTYPYSGPCAGGGNWLVVLTIDDAGIVTGRDGVNCVGEHWRDRCSTHPASAPDLPTTSDYLYTSESSHAWVRWNRTADGRIIRMWGMTAAGDFWEADLKQRSLL